MDNVKIIGVDCKGSILKQYHETGDKTGAHGYVLEGIGEDFLPENVQFDVIDQFLMVEDEESFLLSDAEKEDLIHALQEDVDDIQRESDKINALKEQSKSIKDN